MKKFNLPRLFFIFFVTVSSFTVILAQTENAPDASRRQTEPENRPNLLKELGLTTEQRQQIRQINLEKRQAAQDARTRLDEANINLDRAIYANSLNEAEIQARIKQVQAAQAELLTIRSTNEIAVRKILTAEQLARFRNLRDRFGRKMRNDFYRPGKNPNQVDPRRLRIRQRGLRRN